LCRKRKSKKERKRSKAKKNRRKTHETGKKKQEEEFRIFCAFSATCDAINFAVKNGSSLRRTEHNLYYISDITHQRRRQRNRRDKEERHTRKKW
jgi:hypothetical protein